jgi:hypothetical protein
MGFVKENSYLDALHRYPRRGRPEDVPKQTLRRCLDALDATGAWTTVQVGTAIP